MTCASRARLEVHCTVTQLGDELCIIGAPEALGAWDPARALRLQTSAELFPEWTADVTSLPDETEFKLVICGPFGLTWEPLTTNRYWPALPAGTQVTIRIAFGDADMSCALRPRDSPMSFRPMVSCSTVPDLRDLDGMNKAELWWERSDFIEFLRASAAIGRAYSKVARQLGVPIRDVPRGAVPEMLDESRRGLSLGRVEARSLNNKRYRTAVLEEQDRQRSCQAGALLFLLDWERLGQVAAQASSNDRLQAKCRAENDSAWVQLLCSSARPLRKAIIYPTFVPSSSSTRLSPATLGSPVSGLGHSSPRAGDAVVPSSGMVRVKSVELADTECMSRSLGSSSLLSSCESFTPVSEEARGFGLSRDQLEEAGLSAIGR